MDKLQTIKELVNIKSYGDDNTEIIEYLVKKFTPYAKEILKIKNSCGNKNNLIVSLNCELKNAKNPIILSGHIDTVLADEKHIIQIRIMQHW